MKTCLTQKLFEICHTELQEMGITLEYLGSHDAMEARGKVKGELSPEQWQQAYFTVYRLMAPELGTLGHYYFEVPQKGFEQGYDQRTLVWSVINDILIDHFQFPKALRPPRFYHPEYHPNETTTEAIKEQIHRQQITIRVVSINSGRDQYKDLRKYMNKLSQPELYNNKILKGDARDQKINFRTQKKYEPKSLFRKKEPPIFSDKIATVVLPDPKKLILFNECMNSAIILGLNYSFSDTQFENSCYKLTLSIPNDKPKPTFERADAWITLQEACDFYKQIVELPICRDNAINLAYYNIRFRYNLDSLSCLFCLDRHDAIKTAIASESFLLKNYNKKIPLFFFPTMERREVVEVNFSDKLFAFTTFPSSEFELGVFIDFVDQEFFFEEVRKISEKEFFDFIFSLVKNDIRMTQYFFEQYADLIQEKIKLERMSEPAKNAFLNFVFSGEKKELSEIVGRCFPLAANFYREDDKQEKKLVDGSLEQQLLDIKNRYQMSITINNNRGLIDALKSLIDTLTTPHDIQYLFNAIGIGLDDKAGTDRQLSGLRCRLHPYKFQYSYRETDDSYEIGKYAKARLKAIVMDPENHSISLVDHRTYSEVFGRKIKRRLNKGTTTEEWQWYQKYHQELQQNNIIARP